LLENKLDICLITYNRSKFVYDTLVQFVNSPFKNCRITVLDNCSTDNTNVICCKLTNSFKNFRYIKNKFNISGDANYLRAIEVSDKLYTWVICDDDFYDFSDCNDVIEAIDSEKYDIISVGSDAQYDWERGLITTPKELIDKKARFFSSYTYFPSMIIKNRLFDSECAIKAFKTLGDYAPNFPFLYKAYENNFSIFTSKKNIVLHNVGDFLTISRLSWFTGWVNNCSNFIKEENLKRDTITKIWERGSLLKFLILAIMLEKITANKDHSIDKNDLFKKLALIFLGFTWDQKIMMLFALPFCFVPSFFYLHLYNLYNYICLRFFGKKNKNYLNFEQ